MRTALTALSIGLTTLGMAAPSFAQLPIPRIHVQVGTPQPPPVYVAPAPVQPVPQPPQYGYGYGYGNGYGRGYYRGGGPRWQDPQFFSMRVHDQMEQIRSNVRGDVQQGLVSPAVFGEMRARREFIENDLRAASADGVITFDERQRVMQNVDQLRTLDDRFRVRGPYGGGPWHRHFDDGR